MHIGKLSRQSGVPPYLIRYYVKTGLLPPPFKTNPTRAEYNESHLKRLLSIQNLKQNRRASTALLKLQLELKADGVSESRKEKIRGRRIKLKGDLSAAEKEKEILAAAVRLFAGKGYRQTSVKDITDSLGYSTGTFYKYFESKRQIFIAAFSDVLKDTVTRMESYIRAESDFFRRKILLAEAVNENYSRLSEIFTQLRAEAADKDSWAGENIKHVFWEMTRPFIKELDQGIERGLIRAIDAELLTSAMIGMYEMLLFRLSLDDRYDLSQILAFMSNLLFFGVNPSRKTAPPPEHPSDYVKITEELVK